MFTVTYIVRTHLAALIQQMLTDTATLFKKGRLFSCNHEYLETLLDRVVCGYKKRRPLYNAQYLWHSPRNYSRNPDDLHSIYSRGHIHIEDMGSNHQMVGQIHYFNQAKETDLAWMSQERRLVVDYKDFCESQVREYERLRACCQADAMS